MRKSRILFALSAALYATLLMPAKVAAQNDHEFQMASNLEIFNAIMRDLDIFYVDTIDPKKTIETGIKAVVRSIDPYTEYFPEADMQELKTMTTGKYAGIGAIIRQYQSRDYIYIDEPYEGMPAQKVGLKAGDMILSIDGESMKGKPSSYVSDHLRGDAGTTLQVTVSRSADLQDSLQFTIERRMISLPAVPYYGIIRNNVGYILLEQFTEHSSRQVLQAVVELKQQGAKGLILDLRGNGGGLLQEAVDIVGLFVEKGTKIVEVKGKNPLIDQKCVTQKNPADTEIPVVVLIDGESASASEIVSGSLQDLDRAIVLGSRSYGKGLVQTTRPLPYGGSFKLTTAKYYIPSGRCIQEIDYSKRNDKGQAQHIPDSLTRVFYTIGGRQVRDGGGIRPDVECIPDTIPELVYALAQDVVLFDFVNEYCKNNVPTVSMEQFKLDPSVYRQFKEYLNSSEFSYTSSSSKALKSLRSIAQAEGLDQKSMAEFNALEAKLQYNLEEDLDMFQSEMERLIAVEIATRYYYQKGAVIQGLAGDKCLDQAIELLGDNARYREILKPVAVSGTK